MPKIKVKTNESVMVRGQILIPKDGGIELDQEVAEALGLVDKISNTVKNATTNKSN